MVLRLCYNHVTTGFETLGKDSINSYSYSLLECLILSVRQVVSRFNLVVCRFNLPR